MDLPLPPTQVDDAHLIPWVLGAMFIGLLIMFKLFYDRHTKLELKFDVGQDYTKTVLVEALNNSTQAIRDNKREVRDLRNALVEYDLIPSEMKADSETDIYPVLPTNPPRTPHSG